MKLISYGCSFIFGMDIDDATMIPGTAGRPSKKTWPALLAKHLGSRHTCRAYPGCGNLLIAERILLDIESLGLNSRFVIGWSWIDRFDYNDSDHNDNWNTIRPGCTDKNSKFYYKNLQSEYRDKLVSLMTIKCVIDALKAKKIPFVMTYMDDLLFDTRWNTSDSIKYLQDYIRPYMTDFEGKTFLEWSRQNGYAESTNWHPLEQAHKAAADYMIEKQQVNRLWQN